MKVTLPLLVLAGALVVVSPAAPARADQDPPPVLAAPQVTVAITATGYDPPSVQISPGTSVVWVNLDQASHTVSSLEQTPLGFLFASGTIWPQARWAWAFTKVGRHQYASLADLVLDPATARPVSRLQGVVIVTP